MVWCFVKWKNNIAILTNVIQKLLFSMMRYQIENSIAVLPNRISIFF